MNPPEGSNIQVSWDRGFEKLVAPHGSGGVMRIFMALFLMAWLGGWAFGWISAFSNLIVSSGNEGVSAFLIFWLVGWTVGGVFAIIVLFRLLSPSVPEQYTFRQPELDYDSGKPPFTMSFDQRSQKEMWKK